MNAEELRFVPMTRAVRQRAILTRTCHQAVRCGWPVLATALFAVMASASAMQQATAVQHPQARTPVATRGVSAQAANDAAAAQLEPVPQDAQDSAPPPQTRPVDAPPTDATQAVVAPSSMAAIATVTNGSPARGVLFRIFAPVQTTLPAELAIPESAAADAPPAAIATAAVNPVPPAEPAIPAQSRPSYVLGTIHFGTPEEQGVDYAVLEKALAEVDTFVNEADIDEAWKPAYDDYRWLSPVQPLSAMVSKDSYAMARSLLPNVRAQDLVRMKPWSVLALLEARGETGGDTTMDARLQRIAAATGKRLVHLETLQQQLQALDCVPATEHALVLDERLRAPWILRDESAAAMNYYRTRNLEAWLADIDHMYGLSYAGKVIEQRSRQCLLEERNARWIGQLETLFQDGSGFVAVGAVHLVGPDGLLAALRRDGYRIEAVPL